jgi:hypothetical protein
MNCICWQFSNTMVSDLHVSKVASYSHHRPTSLQPALPSRFLIGSEFLVVGLNGRSNWLIANRPINY